MQKIHMILLWLAGEFVVTITFMMWQQYPLLVSYGKSPGFTHF
jgi:hypothetical protein